MTTTRLNSSERNALKRLFTDDFETLRTDLYRKATDLRQKVSDEHQAARKASERKRVQMSKALAPHVKAVNDALAALDAAAAGYQVTVKAGTGAYFPTGTSLVVHEVLIDPKPYKDQSRKITEAETSAYALLDATERKMNRELLVSALTGEDARKVLASVPSLDDVFKVTP